MIYKEIFEILSLSCITILFVMAEPMILLKRWFGFKEELYDDMNAFKRVIHKLITCCMCSGFWCGIFFTQSIYIAAIVSILAELIFRQLNQIN
jgi:hypothetical protein